MKVGWCCTALEATICYDAPKKFLLDKDKSVGGRGFLSCPSVRGYFQSTFFVVSPFSLHLKHTDNGNGGLIRPVYPFTSLTESKVQEFVKVEPKTSWREQNAIVLQMPSPYVFFTDEPAVIRQEPVQLISPSSHSWRLIPGEFNIYDWQRPLNFAVEWYPSAGDFILKAGEPIYFLSFANVDGGAISPIELIDHKMTPELQAQLDKSRGVTSMRRGIKPLQTLAGKLRKGRTLLSK